MLATTQKSPLETIRDVLEEDDFAMEFVPASETHPIDQLFVMLGKDSKERAYTVEMHFVNDAAHAMGAAEGDEGSILLQLFVPMPFAGQGKNLGDLARCLMVFNRLLPIGAFGMTDSEGHVYFQYNLMQETRAVDEDMLSEALAMVGFFIGEFAPKIESVAGGTTTFAAFVQELKNLGIDLPGLDAKR